MRTRILDRQKMTVWGLVGTLMGVGLAKACTALTTTVGLLRGRG